jgi:molybdopterin converting factor small subunit
MQVNFYGNYRHLAGGKTIELSITPGSTLLDLLNAVTAAYPALRDEIFDEHGSLFPYIPLFINGRNPRLLEDGIHTVIEPQDVLSIFTPISSGRINVEDANQSLSS